MTTSTLPDETMTRRALPVVAGRETWRELRVASRGHRLRLVGVVVVGLLSATLGLVTPAALGRLIDQASTGTADLSTIVWTAVVMIAAAVASATGTGVTVVLAARSYQTMLAELRERLVERAMHLPQSTVEQAGTGDLISRTNDDVTAIADAAPQIIPAFTRAGFAIIATLAGITVLDWRYGLIILAALPVWAVTVRWYLRTGPRVYRAERAAMSGRAQQITGIGARLPDHPRFRPRRATAPQSAGGILGRRRTQPAGAHSSEYVSRPADPCRVPGHGRHSDRRLSSHR